MALSCRVAACIPLVFTLVAGCATRAVPTQNAPAPEAADVTAQRRLVEAANAQTTGHFVAALDLYTEAARLASDVEVRRRALLALGLLHLQPEPAVLDIEQARAALVHAHSLYAGTVAPAELTAVLWTLDELIRARAALDVHAAAGPAADTAARGQEARLQRLREENRSLQRTVEQLQGEVAKRDAALRTAAQALVDRPGSR